MTPRASSRAPAAPSAAPDLDPYRRKRDFAKTPEPAPGGTPAASGFSFLVQKHAARRLHYDFRLEMNGVLKSWAVTKGPSLDPSVKRLAVHVEDHPLEYGGFEGIIPQGEYGGGTVMLWDRGRWQPEEDPEAGYAKGKLVFRLFGKRMKGGWKLVRMGGRAGDDGKNWLLLKVADAAARPDDGDHLLAGEARSVVSRRTMPGIAAAADRVWRSDRAPDTAGPGVAGPDWPMDPQAMGDAAPELPDFVPPALATLVGKPPSGDDWLHEIKFDGYRMQCRVADASAALRTRTGLDWSERFRGICEAAARLPIGNAILDGEVVALEPSGISSFSMLQDALKSGRSDALVYYVFDLLFVEGRDLRAVALHQRKALLQALLAGSAGPLRYSDHHQAAGEPLLASACRMALEGIVSKRRDAPYRSGRGRDWLKSKCVERQEFVIGGFTKPTTGVRGIGALLLGYHRDGALVYVGRVGTGFDEGTSRALRDQLDAIVVQRSPFADVPAAARRGVVWVEPKLVCEVEFRAWTGDGRLRHASFQGLREDKPAESVHLERAEGEPEAGPPARVSTVVDEAQLTHPDRVLYPEQGLTKRGLAEYYAEITDWILPHVAGRPLSLVRCPGGQGKPCFYQKHISSGLPAGLREVAIRESKGEKAYPVLDDVEGLMALVQLGVLEIHPWGSTAEHVEQPDRLIFDLDPDVAVGWETVIAAAREIRERLLALRLRSFVKTTGGKGLHVVVPIIPEREWDEVKAFCQGLADACVKDAPDRYTASLAKVARPGKIFIDYLRNGRGATAVAAYSPRARPSAPVATPLAWDELGSEIASDHFTVQTLPRRLRSLERDPWEGFADLRQSISAPPTRPRRRRARG